MTRLRIQTPSRLHFGLLSLGPDAPRQFGGVGLMIDAPGLELTAESAPDWSAEGPLASRAFQVAARVAERLASAGTPAPPAHFQIARAPAEHVGLGVGTQLSLAVARLLVSLAGLPEPSIEQLADLSGRGVRSGIGLHGFLRGGLIVDGGRRTTDGLPPLLARIEFPPEWSILVLIPEQFRGLYGPEEVRAFAELPSIPDSLTDRLCRLVLLGLLPAIIERDILTFGVALSELQYHVGQCFAPAQGGLHAQPDLTRIVHALRKEGLQGVGQSSWGPTLYAFSASPEEERTRLIHQLRERFRPVGASMFWTRASQFGASTAREESG